MPYSPPEAAAFADSGQSVMKVEFRPWLPLMARYGMLSPGMAQYEGPKTALTLTPGWLRSPYSVWVPPG